MIELSVGASPDHAALDVSMWAWGFLIAGLIGGILADLFVFNRKHETPTVRKSALLTLLWVGVGALVGVLMLLNYGATAGGEYYSGWLIEYSLSVDNVFVWSVILGFFAVPSEYRHRVLFWGIFGALIMRFAFIFAGITVIERFAPAIILLGLFLIWSAIKLARSDDGEMDVSKTRSYRFFTKIIPTADGRDHGAKFFVRVGGKRMVTYLFICLLVIEVSDVMFAVDSVPAILAIARDPFIVFASNAMAIMGLRSLYFLFDAIKDLFSRLNEGLAIILGGVGVKMILSSEMDVFGWFSMPGIHVPTWLSLAFITTVLVGSIIASKVWPEKEETSQENEAPAS